MYMGKSVANSSQIPMLAFLRVWYLSQGYFGGALKVFSVSILADYSKKES